MLHWIFLHGYILLIACYIAQRWLLGWDFWWTFSRPKYRSYTSKGLKLSSITGDITGPKIYEEFLSLGKFELKNIFELE